VIEIEDFASPNDFAAHEACHPDEGGKEIAERKQPHQAGQLPIAKHEDAGSNRCY
jgi:hypothetical protein